MPIILLALISIMAFYPMEWATIALASLMTIFASVFYIFSIKLTIGVAQSTLNDEMDIPLVWTKQIIDLAAVGALIASGGWYLYAGVFAIGWVLVSTGVNIIATLSKMGLIEIVKNDDD